MEPRDAILGRVDGYKQELDKVVELRGPVVVRRSEEARFKFRNPLQARAESVRASLEGAKRVGGGEGG